MQISRVARSAAVLLIGVSAGSAQNYWQPTNGPEGGEVKAMVILADSSVLVSTGPMIFRSTDGGGTWTMNTSLFSGCLAVAPNGTVFSGQFGASYSTDNGVTWNPRGLAGQSVAALGAAANGYVFAGCGYPSIVYRSTDNGASWQVDTVGFGAGAGQTNAIVSGPSGTVFVSQQGKGVFRSTNNGDTWSKIHSVNATGVTVGLTGNLYIVSSAGVLRSTDNGTTWGFKNSGLVSTDLRSIVSLPSGDLLVCSDNVYRSTNNGDSWQGIGVAAFASGTHHLVNAGNPKFYVGLYARGVYRTTDGGTSWAQRISGFRATANKAIAAKSTGEVIAAGTTDVFLSTDNGTTWVPRSNGLTVHAQSIQSLGTTPSGAVLAVSAINSNLFRTTDNGTTWTQVVLSQAIPGPFISLPPGLVLGGSTGVYRSTDNGQTWTKTSSAFSQTVNAFIRHSNGTLYVGASFGGAYASTDTGKTWTPKGLTSQDIKSLVETGSGALLAAVSYTGVYRSTDGGSSWNPLSTTTTGTQPQKLFRTGTVRILGVFTSPVGVDSVFESTDEGTTWAKASSGLPFGTTVADVAVSSSGMVLAATSSANAFYGGIGVVRAAFSVSAVDASADLRPTGHLLGQNYPNPFNPATVIRYTVSAPSSSWGLNGQSSLVSLKVYDLLGREVAVLVNGVKAPGTYSVTFNASGLASGVYLYRLAAGSYVETRKLLVLR